MSFDIDSLKQQIPHYLTSEDQKILVEELRSISKGGEANYFLSDHNNEFTADMLQGDGWRGFKIYRFDKNDLQSISGLVLSNSCDIDPNNRRDTPTRITFVPLVKLSRFESILRKSGLNDDIIKEKISAIRAQKITTIFFLPSGGPLTDDYIARLDEAHSMPWNTHNESEDKEKLFTLNNTGFYMLVLKLSVHFCRLQEKVNRSPKIAPA